MEKDGTFRVMLRDISPDGEVGRVVALDIQGDIDLHTVASLGSAVDGALTLMPPGGLLVINLAEVPFLDSTAQARLISLARSTCRHGGTLDVEVALCCGSRGVTRALMLMQAHRYLPMYETEADALSTLSDGAVHGGRPDEEDTG